MNGALLNLAPLIVAAALAPAFVILSLLLLRGDGGLVKAFAFAVGVIAVSAIFGGYFLWKGISGLIG